MDDSRRVLAASVVQRAFRRFINVRIYKYYRNLVNFRNRGDPGLLLRCINPSEAALVQDRASGAVVRFRLGGSVFPPIVYYKVYLRNPVTDLGSFAPRDYTVGKPDQFYMLRRHNDGCQNEVRAQSVRDVTHQVDTSLWYHRFENNGWRPIANKHLHAHDQVTRSTAARRNADFHHVAEVRRMMATTKRDHKKSQWMQRMYRPPQETTSTTAGDLGWEDLDIDEVRAIIAGLYLFVIRLFPAKACAPCLFPGFRACACAHGEASPSGGGS